MKKLINLIALVMLVSTNVLTPFSYAQEDVPELIPENEVEMVSEDTGESEKILENNENTLESNEKTPENNEGSPKNNEATSEINPEDKEELEQGKQEEELHENILPDAQDDVKTPTIDENKDEDTEKVETNEVVQPMEEKTENEMQDENLKGREVEGDTEKGEQEENLEGDEVEEDSSLQKVDEFITMEVIPNTSVTLLPGTGFNGTIKRLAGGNGATYISGNSTITQIVQTGNIPEGVITGEISEPDSEYPVYAYFTGGILYYTTQAETIYMNPDSSFMFARMSGITRLNLNNLNTENVINMSFMFRFNDVINVDISEWDTSNVTNMSFMFNGCSSLTELDLSSFDTSNVSNLGAMFYGCSSLTGLDLSNFDTSNVTNIQNMFTSCNNLAEINFSGWDFRNVNEFSFGNVLFWGSSRDGIKKLNMTNTKFSGNLYRAFAYLPNLEEIRLDGVDTSKVTSMQELFSNCSSLTGLDLSDFDTSNVMYMNSMFNKCSNLTGLDLSNFDTSNVTNMQDMFYGCNKLETLNVSGWDFSKAMAMNINHSSPFNAISSVKTLNLTNAKFGQSMVNMFAYMGNLEELILEGSDTSNVLNMQNMFYDCDSLTGLDLSNFDTSNVTNMSNMFYDCDSLTGLDLSNFDTSNVSDMRNMFNGCSKLEELNMSGWKFNGSSMIASMTNGQGIPSLKKLDLTNTKYTGSMAQSFKGYTELEEIKLEGVDTSNVTDMKEMFYGCKSLTGLDLSSFDTSSLKNYKAMFNGCTSIETLNLDGWDLRNITINYYNNEVLVNTPKLKKLSAKGWKLPENFYDWISRYWGNDSDIEEIDVSNWDLSQTKNLQGLFGGSRVKTIKGLDTWDTSSVTNMGSMFYGCSSLTGLDLSSFDTSNVTDMQAMFNGCSKLENLNLDNWNLGKNPNMGGFIVSTPSLKTISMSGWKIPENFTHRLSRNWGNGSHIEEVDVTNWDLSETKDVQGLFGDSGNLKTIKGLDTWDTSNVTNMSQMFYGCSILTGLNLSSFDTSNVTNMGGIFGGCNKLEDLNLSGWDFRNINNASLMMSLMGGTPQSLKKLNMTNTKYTGNASYAFGGLNKLEELNLDGADTKGVTNMNAMFNGDSKLKDLDLSSFDTSNVTNMPQMFYNCSGLNELDLTNFNTSKVTVMGQMFFNTPNLKTIYASEKFVTTALSGDNSSKDMFSGTTSVIGGNGTKFNSNFIDEEYAKIDKVGQTGYFTDKNAINVKFINTLDGTETLSTFAKGQKVTPPSVNGYHAVGGYLDEAMTQKIDLNKGVDSYTVIYVKYDHNGSSGGGGGGGGSTKPDTPKDEQQSAEPSQSDASSGTDVKEPETNTGTNIQTGSQVDSSEQTPQNDNSNTQDSPTSSQNDGKTYSTEFQEAYEFAKGNGITTMPTIQKANMEGKLTRIAMAKMLSQYAINVLGKTPDTSKTIKFKDVTSKKDADYDNGVTLAYQLGIMGQNMPNNKFRPNDEVSRAEFVTALSRLLYQTTDGEYKSTSKYYTHHIEKLEHEGIITNVDPGMKERRGYVMIMLMRSAK